MGPPDEKSAIWSFGIDRGDGDRAGRVRRRADRAVAEVVEVVAGGDDRDHAGRRGGVDRLHDEVARRVDLGLAERQVDHVHPVGDGRLDRGGDLGAVPVEAEARASAPSAPCSCRCTRSARRRRSCCRSRSRRSRRRRCRRRASRGTTGSGRTGRSRTCRSSCGGANVRWTITFGVVYCVCPFGKPGGYVKPLGLKYGCAASRPSSMIPILMPLPAVANVEPQSWSAPICETCRRSRRASGR